MTPQRLLRRLADAGFGLREDEGDLVVTPGAPLTDGLRRLLRLRKPQLLDALADGLPQVADPPCVDCGRPLPLSGVRCPGCRDALEEPTCASCGAVEEQDICDICRIEASPQKAKEEA